VTRYANAAAFKQAVEHHQSKHRLERPSRDLLRAGEMALAGAA
jgi:hypothetical protein